MATTAVVEQIQVEFPAYAHPPTTPKPALSPAGGATPRGKADPKSGAVPHRSPRILSPRSARSTRKSNGLSAEFLISVPPAGSGESTAEAGVASPSTEGMKEDSKPAAGPSDPTSSEALQMGETPIDPEDMHTRKKGFLLPDYPDVGHLHLYEVLASPADPAGPAANGEVLMSNGKEPASPDGVPGHNAPRPRPPMPEILQQQPLGLLMPKLLPPLEPFVVQMPGRPDCNVTLRYLGPYELTLEQRTDLALYHRTLLRGRSMRDDDRSTHQRCEVHRTGSRAQACPKETGGVGRHLRDTARPGKGGTCTACWIRAVHACTADDWKADPHRSHAVDWEIVERCKLGLVACKDLNADDIPLEKTLLVTPYNAFLYRLLAVRRDISVLDPMDEKIRKARGSVAGKTWQSGSVPIRGGSYIAWYKERWDVKNVDPSHPMLGCQNLQRGFTVGEEDARMDCELHQDLCLIHPLTYLQLHLAAFAPKILFWLQVQLLAIELREAVFAPAMPHSMVPGVSKVVEALMPMACRQDVNYERLEILGDAFLKYAASLYVFTAFPRAHEGQMTARKMTIICNKTLIKKAIRMGLAAYVALNPDVYNWENGRPEGTMKFRSKMLADLVEALIGAAFSEGNEEAAFAFLDYNNICPRAPSKPRTNSVAHFSKHIPKELLKVVNHDAWSSWGDAVLDLVISRHYILGYGDLVPGQLHDLRSASLNNNRLACVAGGKGLHRFLRHCSLHLFHEIARFVEALKDTLVKALQDVREKNGDSGLFREEQLRVGNYRGGARGASDLQVLEAAYNQATAAGFGKEGGLPNAPKVMGDLVEALVGAVFLDLNADVDATWEVIRSLLEPLVTPDTCPIHPVRMLLELSSKAGLPLPVFRAQPSEVEGLVAVDCLVEHPTTGETLLKLGRCESAPNKLTGRMLSAERAVQNWDRMLPDIKTVAHLEHLRRHGGVVVS
eukprot:jgi/Botrbrau1/14204/Bobra.0291s0009.1